MRLIHFSVLAVVLLVGCNRQAGSPASESGSLTEARKGFQTKLVQGKSARHPAPPPPPLFRMVRYDSPAGALAAYLHNGSTSRVVGEYRSFGVQNENEFAVYLATECSDVNWPRNWATWNTATRRVYATAPFEAWDNAWFNAACAFWPVHGPAHPLQINGAGLPGILMIQGTLDAATPYAGAQVAHGLLPSARMVVVAGGGNHGQSLSQPPNTCVDSYLNAYLATGALPQHPGQVNATCPALAAPSANG